MKTLIVGAGLFGATCARKLVDYGFERDEVIVIDKALHVAGHCHTPWDEAAGMHVHEHGAHIFHTSDEEVWQFVNRFCDMKPFLHRVKATVGKKIYSLPINLATLHQVYGAMHPRHARRAVLDDMIRNSDPQNMEEWCLANIGAKLYRLFIEGYTTKQWGKHPRDLPATIIKRLPVRYTFEDNYFNDPHQGIPADGYTSMVERMLEGIDVRLDTPFDYAEWKGRVDRIIFTGPIDELLGYCFGPLEYRGLQFRHDRLTSVDDFQGCAVMNYPSAEVPYTRSIEHKHFQPHRKTAGTIVTWEYPAQWQVGEERFYPVVTPENEALHKLYLAAFSKEFPEALAGGRLGMFKYMDMDQTIRAAMNLMHTDF